MFCVRVCVYVCQVLEWQAGADKAELRFSCGLANNTPSLAAERSLFIRASAAVFEALKRYGHGQTLHKAQDACVSITTNAAPTCVH